MMISSDTANDTNSVNANYAEGFENTTSLGAIIDETYANGTLADSLK